MDYRQERENARKLLKDARGFTPSQAERNVIQVNEMLLDHIADIMAELAILENKVENLQSRLDYHNLS